MFYTFPSPVQSSGSFEIDRFFTIINLNYNLYFQSSLLIIKELKSHLSMKNNAYIY